ncbi:endonuclease/exonuclease/phosphatase family protein [Ramlibacter rhizophilus]|uniref:Endonuclease n=1 Tax=Ramlibacter rhizophilus TaxID=1781167 RepID=A0A4Z0BKS7_9BURK|nr:endonuclease/exonuclease/phosphatase family protein [Ramlibacter rhizophilus]TFY99932.1 endonuclease [Ramlibacter rhizophilus]
MWNAAAVTLGALVIVLSVLPLLRSKVWWIRVWEFPRLQLGLLGVLALAWLISLSPLDTLPRLILVSLLALCTVAQFAAVWRYSRLAPVEAQTSDGADPDRRLSLTVSNVLESNRQADRLLAQLRQADADIVLCVETDDWWREQLDALTATHPHTIACPIANTYGMLLYSRLPLHEPRIEFLVQDDVPSFHMLVGLRNGQRVRLHCVHPRPPAPSEAESSVPRDAELLMVARKIRDETLPVILCGDLNDVAWSRTTRQFQKVSGLLDPRKGRGMFATFHARLPGLRFPLDHIFHSPEFRLVSMGRLGYVGSDHFPMHAVFSLEPSARHVQSAPQADAEDLQEARETVAQGLREEATPRQQEAGAPTPRWTP